MSIRPEVIANKLAAIRRGEYPGLSKELETTPALAEMLWFLQFVSLEPGGLQKFASELLKDFHEHLGTELMLKVGTPKNGRYSAQQAANIWSEIDRKGEIFRLGWASEVYTVEDFSEIERGESAFAKENSELLERLCPETAQAHCGKAAEAELASFLAQYCNNPAQSLKTGPWYFRSLSEIILRVMENWELQALDGLAETSVSVQVFDSLDYALAESTLVLIEGNSRFGKTESLERWCRKRPGRARLVTVPCMPSDSDFFRAIGDALGIEHSLSTPIQALREKIEFVLNTSRLCLVFDEAQFLFPTRLTATTPPNRLNWFRMRIVDKKLPCALAVTPQSYWHSQRQFVRKTGYSIEQFTGRIGMTVKLPETLTADELTAVAKAHFPEFPPKILRLIALKAAQTESYLKAIEHVSKRARYLARKAGSEVSLPFVETALGEVLEPGKRVASGTAAKLPRPKGSSKAKPGPQAVEAEEAESRIDFGELHG